MRCDGLVAEVQDWAAGSRRYTPGSPAGSPGPSRGPGGWPICAGCLVSWSARTAGRWPRPPGEVSPDGMQRLLRTADWNADAVRDQLLAYVVERLGAGGVLIVDETRFIKKGAARPGWAGSTPAPPARSTT